MEKRRAIVTVVGKDKIGIISKVTTVIADYGMNILDISQTILQDFFTMMMIIDVSNHADKLDDLRKTLDEVGNEIGVKINIQLEDIFQAMHRI